MNEYFHPEHWKFLKQNRILWKTMPGSCFFQHLCLWTILLMHQTIPFDQQSLIQNDCLVMKTSHVQFPEGHMQSKGHKAADNP